MAERQDALFSVAEVLDMIDHSDSDSDSEEEQDCEKRCFFQEVMKSLHM